MKFGPVITIVVAAFVLALFLHFLGEQREPRDKNSSVAPAAGDSEAAQSGHLQTGPGSPGPVEGGFPAEPRSVENPAASPALSANTVATDTPEDTQTSDDAQQATIQARVDELYELAAEQTPQAMETVLSELTNRSAEIRQAARQATASFGSREAIPKLEAAIAQTDNPAEKAALKETIQFLMLPSLSDVMNMSGSARTTSAAPGR